MQDIGWRKLVQSRRGRSNLSDGVGHIDHAAARYLDFLRKHGQPVQVQSPPPSLAQLDAAVKRGPHPSAVEYQEFLREEALDMCNRRHTMVLPYSAVKHLPGLRLSPPGVVPQRERRPRTIVDLTFSGVNKETVHLAHHQSMQFGHSLLRILLKIHHADPRWGPVHLSKTDLSDGFYNVSVNPDGVTSFGVLLPQGPLDPEPLILFFLGLPMGWVLSPPVFCALSETVADIANKEMATQAQPPMHPQEEAAATPTPTNRPPSVPGLPPRIRVSKRGPLGAVDVFVDDFILMAQGGPRRKKRLRRILFHSIEKVFRKRDSSDPPSKRDIISLKKLLKGDGSLETSKVVLGWLIDTVALTIELPPHRVDRLNEMLAAFPASRKRASISDLQKLLGELRSMILAIPGGLGLLSWFQEALKNSSSRVYLSQGFRDAIADFKWLASEVASRPTRIAEVVPDAPSFEGMVDASGAGMGGVWLEDSFSLLQSSLTEKLRPTLTDSRRIDTSTAVAAATNPLDSVPAAYDERRVSSLHPPIVWRAPFSEDVRPNLACTANPTGPITNSDLELAGIIAHQDVLAQETDIRETTTSTGTDNTAALAWQTKQAVSSTGPAAYLLRLSALHRRAFRYQCRTFYVPGLANKMADDASRLWHFSDSELLAYFNRVYPQRTLWQLRHLRPEMASALNSCLFSRRPQPAAILNEPGLGQTSGRSGATSARHSTKTPCSTPSTIRYPCFSSSNPATIPANWHLRATPSALALRKRLCDRWGVRSSNWARETHV